LGDYQKAINDLAEALARKPGDPIGLTRRGQAYEALGQKALALDDSARRSMPMPRSRARRRALPAS